MLSLPPIADPVRDALDVQVRHFTHLVNLATITVAVGVALEGIEIIHDGIAWAKRKKREKRECSHIREIAEVFPVHDIKKAPESHSEEPRWVKRTLRIGLIAVVIGVVGEWRYGARLEDAHNAVHQYDLAKIQAANEKAGNADDSAERAGKAADHAEKVSGKASDSASRAKTASATALLSAGTTKEKADAIAAVAEQLRKEVEELSPRILSVGQQLLIRKACSGFQYHLVRVVSYATDGEASQLAGQIIAVLKAAHINVADARGSQEVIGGFDIGVHIRGPEQESAFISCLSDALSTIGKLEVVKNDPPPKTGGMMLGGGQAFKPGTVFVTVMVGVKPVPVLPVE